MNEKRAFRGVWIPAEIWLSKDLSITEKCILTEIDSLDNKDGCIASNPYFAKFFGIRERMIRYHIKSLQSKKYITVELIGRNRRRILMARKYRQVGNKLPSLGGNKLPHSNTVNNTYINKGSLKKLLDMKKLAFHGKGIERDGE